MRIDVLTLFPEMFAPLDTSIIGRAREGALLDVAIHDIRPFSKRKHKNTDDYPFGGGAGMLMMVQPLVDAIRAVSPAPYKGRRILLSPRGQVLTQQKAQELAGEEQLLLICGHYEGVDERVIDHYVDEELSIGDYVLTGGELPAMVLIDCVARLLPGVLGSEASAEDESFSDGLLEYPQYTRPRLFEGHAVPEVLLSGDHARIASWRKQQALLLTHQRRPDLLEAASLTDAEWLWLKEQTEQSP